jgi:hypothetical protein
MWDPELQIPVEFRNLEPIWRKLNKVWKGWKGRVQKAGAVWREFKRSGEIVTADSDSWRLSGASSIRFVGAGRAEFRKLESV